jgi:hypothetical protein
LLGGAAQGDFSRAWAWRQLGLWPGGSDVRGVGTALATRPELSAPTLREAATRGWLGPLLRALPAETWVQVARAALAAAGASVGLAGAAEPQGFETRAASDVAREDGAPSRRRTHHRPADPPAAAAPPGAAGDDEALRARVRQVAAASPLCRAAMRAAAFGLSPVARRALAALALADADPAALRGARAPRFVAALDDEMRSLSGVPARAHPRGDRGARASAAKAEAAHVAAETPSDDDQAGTPAVPAAGVSHAPADPLGRSHDSVARPATPQGADARRGRARAANQTAATAPAGRTHGRSSERDTRAHPADDAGDEAAMFDDAAGAFDSDHEPPIARQRGHTRFGGLLFLLHVVDALGLPDQWSDAGPLAARPLRVALHGLALALLRDAGHDGVAPGDPAVLAFAGLRPLDPLPCLRLQPSTTAHGETETRRRDEGSPWRGEEQAILDDAAKRIAGALAERLEPPSPRLRASAAAPPDALAAPLARLVERRAEVVADPGWIEVRLALDAVDTRVRRAGLDLDPGYVPWLGVVVKFRYV